MGIRQGATENATVMGELLADLMERGLDFTKPRLYVLDGGKALTAAVKKCTGESAPTLPDGLPINTAPQGPLFQQPGGKHSRSFCPVEGMIS
ncbi:MAG: hypothetical protein ABSE42_21885 [Bryobacteraceae bacterium]